METFCIRCDNSFESESWDTEVCPDCEHELALLEKEDKLELEYDSAGIWDDDDEF